MELATRAYAAFEVKTVGEGKKRSFGGWATTPATDRVGDTINPMGVRFQNPLPLLHQHSFNLPIGTAMFGKPTTKGIPFDAQIPKVEEPLALKERVDVAWGEIEYGLVRAVSIGFRPIKYAYKEDGGIDYQEIEVYELSTVTIPALPEAIITFTKGMHGLPLEMIQEIKRFDTASLKGGIALMRGQSSRPSDGSVKLITR
jgi:HK97 family phage prohead protease